MKSIDTSRAIIVGAREYISLPIFKLDNIEARIDTGAKTSALHVSDIETFKQDGEELIKFVLPKADYPNLPADLQFTQSINAIRRIKSSNSHVERRFVIDTVLNIGAHSWQIELTLTDRAQMKHPMLVGRQALQNNVLVCPWREFLLPS